MVQDYSAQFFRIPDIENFLLYTLLDRVVHDLAHEADATDLDMVAQHNVAFDICNAKHYGDIFF